MKSSLTEKLFHTGCTSLGLLILRLVIGITFMAHGSQKLFGLFGGGGLSGTAAMFEGLGIHPPLFMALLSGCAEFFGGLFLFLGLLTRPVGLVLMINMAVAILTVHLPRGFFGSNGGFEYPLALFTIGLMYLITGPGCYAIDTLIYKAIHKKT
jgi:putative oxidoreductase